MNCLKASPTSMTLAMLNKSGWKTSWSLTLAIHYLVQFRPILLVVVGWLAELRADGRWFLRLHRLLRRLVQQANRMSILIGWPDWTRDRSPPT